MTARRLAGPAILFFVLAALPAAAQPVKTPQAPEGVARAQPSPFRTHTVEIKLAAAETEGSEIEYKVAMKPGAALVYSWSAPDAPATELWTDFHGHQPQDRNTAVTYRQEMTNVANGSLTAPFEGIHGWYLQNQSLKPVTVKLTVSGFYELIPPGQAGNEGGVLPLQP